MSHDLYLAIFLDFCVKGGPAFPFRALLGMPAGDIRPLPLGTSRRQAVEPCIRPNDYPEFQLERTSRRQLGTSAP